MDYLVDISVPEIFILETTNVEELKQIFKEIKNKNSAGYDGISVRLLECLPEYALQALVDSINHSFVVGEFPTCLKDAVVVPLREVMWVILPIFVLFPFYPLFQKSLKK